MGFLRHEEIYRSDGEARSGRWTAPGAHRFDEFPAGYSLAGCSPAEPASASPAGYSIGEKDGAGKLFPANGNLSLFTLSHDRGAAHPCHRYPCHRYPYRYPLPISLSATTVVRLKQVGREEYETWSKRSLEGQRFVYLWADGLYSNLRLDDDRPCLLVVIAALADGRKQLLAVHDGFHESELSWTELLEDLKRRGLEVPLKLAVGDGGLGFGAALRKVYPTTREQQRFNARATTPQHSNT